MKEIFDDTDIDMEIEQHEEHLNPDPPTIRMSVVNPQPNNQEFCGGFVSLEPTEGGQKEESCTNEKITFKDADAKASLDGNLEVNEAKPIQNSVEVAKVMKAMTSRMSGPPVTPADSDVGNKRQKTVCEFYAKGWCIRGKSCRFLHIKEGLDGAACSGALMPPPQTRENSVNSQIEISAVHKHEPLDGALERAGKTPIGQNLCLDYTSPSIKYHSMNMDRARHGNFSGTSGSIYDKSRFFPFGTEETVSKRNEFVPDAHWLNLSSYSRPPMPFGSSSWTSNAHTLGANLTSEQPTKYKNEIFPDGWEPSVPFCPSHVISQNLLLKECPYEPILDNVEQTGAKDGSFEFSNAEPAVSADDAHLQSNKLQKEKPLDANHVEDTRKGIRQKEMEMDGCGKRSEDGLDIKRDDNAQNDSKGPKYFHAALVDYVKELVKPTWREGLMSKDAHKIIVKKAVDKVMSTLQPGQIPNTAESIKSYLSISQVKLSKLVEAYIEIYGKC